MPKVVGRCALAERPATPAGQEQAFESAMGISSPMAMACAAEQHSTTLQTPVLHELMYNMVCARPWDARLARARARADLTTAADEGQQGSGSHALEADAGPKEHTSFEALTRASPPAHGRHFCLPGVSAHPLPVSLARRLCIPGPHGPHPAQRSDGPEKSPAEAILKV